MNIDTINFLPQVYQRRRLERRRVWRHAALLVLLCAALAGWWQMQRGRTEAIRQEVLVHEAQADAARQQMKLVTELRREQAALNQRLTLWQRLSQPVSHGKVFATLAEQLPATVVLTRMEIRSHRQVGSTATAGPANPRRSAGNASGRTPSTESDRLELDFTGIAPSDLTLANLLNELKDHPLFDEVKLHFSRTVEIHGVNGRQFRIEMQVPLDRDYQATPAKEGMAHVAR